MDWTLSTVTRCCAREISCIFLPLKAGSGNFHYPDRMNHPRLRNTYTQYFSVIKRTSGNSHLLRDTFTFLTMLSSHFSAIIKLRKIYLLTAPFICALSVIPRISLARYNDCVARGSPSWPSTTNLANIVVPSALAIGQAIPGGRLRISIHIDCPASAYFDGTQPWAANLGTNLTAAPGLANVYTTVGSVAGIGFRFLDDTGAAIAKNGNSVPFGGNMPAGQTEFAWDGTFELVKISDTPSTGTQSLPWGVSVHNQEWANNNGSDSTFTIQYAITTTPVSTCSVIEQSQTVRLPTVSQASLFASTTSARTPFSISFNCKSGGKLYMWMTDANNPDGNLDYLVNKAGSKYGIKIFKEDGSTVVFGPDSAGGPNQWLVGKAPDGVFKTSFTAAYSRTSTSTPFPAGAFTAKATFTISYQ